MFLLQLVCLFVCFRLLQNGEEKKNVHCAVWAMKNDKKGRLIIPCRSTFGNSTTTSRRHIIVLYLFIFFISSIDSLPIRNVESIFIAIAFIIAHSHAYHIVCSFKISELTSWIHLFAIGWRMCSTNSAAKSTICSRLIC